MRDENRIVRERQLAIRREIDRRGISLKAVSMDSGVKYSTLISYFPGERDREPATISGGALFQLVGVLPLDLLSLLLPEGFAIVPKPDHIDHDDLMTACSEFVAAYGAARHPSSEAGVAIGPREAAKLDTAAGHVRAVVS